MHYWRLHIGDWVKATAHLSATETGLYLRLLNHYYDTEIPLPKDLKAVYRIASARTREDRVFVDLLLSEFFDEEDDGWYNKRANAEIAALHQKSDKARVSAEKRWDRRNANAMRTHSERNARDDADAMRFGCSPIPQDIRAPDPSRNMSGDDHA